jgi:hypothetical protein
MIDKTYRLRDQISRREVARRLGLKLVGQTVLSLDDNTFAGMFIADDLILIRSGKAQKKILEFAYEIPES